MSIMRTLTINGTTYNVAPVVPASSVTLLAGAWVGDEESYSQVVELPGVTPNTKVDLQPTADQLAEFYYKVLAFVAENDGGVVRVFAIGDKPKGDHTIQITLTEVETTGKIRGNTVGTPMPRSNFNQTDSKKADYIIGRDKIVQTVNGMPPDENGNVDVEGGGSGITGSEKNLLLSLFKNAAYTANMSATIAQLEALWSGNVPDVPDEPAGTAYTVTNNLTNVTNSNPQTEVTEGFYSATLRAEDGYTIEATITMGGVDITANVFTAETGTILITAVTGNIVITATAKLASMPVLYRLGGTPKSVSGLAEDTGLAFGSNDASGVANAWSICVAYTGFGPSETLLKMSSGSALNAATNGAGNNSKIRITCCGNVADALSGESANNDYRFVITREKSSLKMISIHYLENGAVKTVTNTGVYGQFNVDVQAGNLLVGSSDIMVNDLTIYKGVLSDAAIATYLSGGEI